MTYNTLDNILHRFMKKTIYKRFFSESFIFILDILCKNTYKSILIGKKYLL